MDKKITYIIMALIIVVVAALLFVFGINGNGTKDFSSYDDKPVPQAILSQLNIPDNVSAAVGIGSTNSYPTKLSASPPLALNGKPEVFYIGANYCPFCAAERWGMVIAMMRFGNFSNLRFMTSSPTDYAPGTATFTFYNSTYTSSYISFVSVELSGNKAPPGGNYPILQSLNGSQRNLAFKLNPSGSTPFLDIANLSMQVGSNFDPQPVLQGKNWSAIASNLNNPSTLQSQSIVGTANLLTAQICKATSNQPQNVCNKQYILQIEKNILR